jgi:hypothetical protein
LVDTLLVDALLVDALLVDTLLVDALHKLKTGEDPIKTLSHQGLLILLE